MSPSSVDASSSASDSESSHVRVEEHGARKRRKLSPVADSDSEDEPQPRSLPTSTLSRVKAKQTGVAQKETPATILASQNYKENLSFASLNVSPWLVASLSAMAIKKPTGIQKGCIPEIIKGRDCIGGSRTGSGKTVAFAAPILQKWSEDPVAIFAVVLTPTRYVPQSQCLNHLPNHSVVNSLSRFMSNSMLSEDLKISRPSWSLVVPTCAHKQ